MAAPKGNKFWEARSSHGTKPKFERAEDLWSACVEYFDWAHDNPLHEAKAFAYEGDVTIVQMSGEFVIHPEKVPGVPAFMARRLAPTLEKFVVGLLQPNLKRSNQAVESYLEDNA